MRVRRMIGYVPQLLSADATLTGRENVELFAKLFDVPRRERAERVDGALSAMGLTEPAGRLVKTYSGGMIRRLELAQALVSAPSLLVLDEPTVGLDPIARSDVWEYIDGAARVRADHRADDHPLHGRGRHLLRPGLADARGLDPGHRHPGHAQGHARAPGPRWTTCSATTPAARSTTTPRREASVTSAAPGVPPAVSADSPPPCAAPGGRPASDTRAAVARRLASRIVTLCWVELRKIRHDRTELYTRAIQPALWLLIFGETFTKIHAIPTPGGIPYLAYLAPGILAQSALFIAIFYGIQIIWERDAGVLTKLMVTPTPRAALISGKAFAAGVRSIVQAAVIVVLAAILGVALTDNPLKLLATAAVVVLGSAFFSCLSMTIAGLALSRDRLMGIGQAITMPLFFSSNALYPEQHHAGLAAGDQQGQPAVLRGGRAARAAHRHPGPPRPRRDRAGRRHGARGHGLGAAAAPPGEVRSCGPGA